MHIRLLWRQGGTPHPGQAVGSQRLGAVEPCALAHQDLLSHWDARQVCQRLLHGTHPAGGGKGREQGLRWG